MMSRGDSGRQMKAGIGNGGKKSVKPGSLIDAPEPGSSTSAYGDEVGESIAENASEMGDGPSEKVRTGREGKAKPNVKYSGAVMCGGNQEASRGAIMSGSKPTNKVTGAAMRNEGSSESDKDTRGSVMKG